MAAVSAGTAQDRASGEFHIRLSTPITSYASSGAGFRAAVIGPTLDNPFALAPGTLIRGVVRNARAVGLGFRRERAWLELDFHSCETPAGHDLPCRVELRGVDNARETVGPGNRVKGILAAGHAHSWLNGVWYRPAPNLATRAAAGLTGTAGAVQSRLAPTPAGAGLILASKLIMVRMPEPEIVLPRGTELIVRVELGSGAGGADAPALPNHAGDRYAKLPATVVRPDGSVVTDLIHLALLGTEDEVTAAFRAAGWSPADPPTARNFARTYAAYTRMASYATAPVSPLVYLGRPPDLVFQKSFNSIAKRHHIRLWKDNDSERPAYLAAATHDVGIGFSWKRLRVTHEVDPEVDRERAKVINDLNFAGCIGGLEVVERGDLAPEGGAITDRRLYVLQVRECAAEIAASEADAMPRRSRLARATRRVVLETRQYFTRGNVFYQGVRGVRVLAVRMRP